MPKPPLITSTAGQRMAVAALMAAMLVGSLAGAYAFTTHHRQDRAAHAVAHQLSGFTITLPENWVGHDPGPFAELIEDAHVFRDATRPSRLLAIGTLTDDHQHEPNEVMQALIERLVTQPVQLHSQFVDPGGDISRVEVCVRSEDEETGVLVQRQFAVVTHAADPLRHVVLYMHDGITDLGTFQQNQMEFRGIHMSVAFTR